MQDASKLLWAITIAGFFAGVAGCSTNADRAQPRANTGYVDLYAEPADALYWNVARVPPGGSDPKMLYSELKPPREGIVRLPLPPGEHVLRVDFRNRVSPGPVEFSVTVEDGRITPVRVTLTESASIGIRTKDTSVGGTIYGRYGRRTRIGSGEASVYLLAATPEPPSEYRPREAAPYKEDLSPAR